MFDERESLRIVHFQSMGHLIRVALVSAALLPAAWGLLSCDRDRPQQVTRLSHAVKDGPVAFATARDISGGSVIGLSALDARDLDGDGLVDVGAFEGGKHAGGRVTFAWFQSPTAPGTGSWVRHDLPYPSPARPFIGAAKFGDVDGDGDYDLVVAMDNHSGDVKSAYLHWLENPRPSNSATSTWVVRKIAGPLAYNHINDMALADLDGDGKLDLITRALEPNRLLLHFQDSITSWTEKVIDATPFGAQGEGFALGNVDGAGEVDITICGFWLRAPAAPRTQPYTTFTIDAAYSTINANVKESTGDIDGDGRLDVIISPAEGYRDGTNHVLAWYRGPVDPSQSSAWQRTVLASDFNGGHTVQLGDMDGDGDLDVVSGVAWSMWGQTQSIKIYYNLGGGSFGNIQTVVNGKGLYTGVLRDLGDDGDLDIIGQDTYSTTSHPYIYESMEASPTTRDAATPTPDMATPTPDMATPTPDTATPTPDMATPTPDATTTRDMSMDRPDMASGPPLDARSEGAPPDDTPPVAPAADAAGTNPGSGVLSGGCRFFDPGGKGSSWLAVAICVLFFRTRRKTSRWASTSPTR